MLAPSIGILTSAQFRPNEWDGDGYTPVAPAIAIEVTQETDREEVVARKIAIYLAAGSEIVWRIRSDHGDARVYTPDGAVRILGKNASLTHPSVLPGIELPPAELFDRRFDD